MAKKGREDLFYLAHVILGYEDLTPHTHGALCRFLQKASYIRRMVLMPRTHFKTTIAVVADSIQLVLNNPDIRILIVSDTDDNAKLMLGEISNHFKENDLFRWLYSDLIPENFNKARWNSNEITVRRKKTHLKEATITSAGAFAAIESKHFDYIKADDLVTEKHIHSDTEMDKLTRWMGGLEPLLDHDQCNIDFIGSRKKKGDPYEFVEKLYSGNGKKIEIGPHAQLRGEVAVFSRSIIEEGDRIFPERVTWAYINRMRKHDPERYHAQLANNPKASGLNTFNEQDLRYFEFNSKTGIIEANYMGFILERVSVWSLDRIILYDPAVSERNTSSQNAILVVAKGAGPRRYVLAAKIGHYQPDEAIDTLFEWNAIWRPEFISIEKRGFQGSIKYWIEERAELKRLPMLPVIEWPAEGSHKAMWAKKEHIRGLQPLVKENLIWLHESQNELREQFEFYPNVRWDDGLDCLSQGLDYWPYTEDEETREDREDKEDRLLSSMIGGLPTNRTREWDEQAFLQQIAHSGYGLKVH